MFKRRIPLTKIQLFKELFWPTMGWMRAVQYVKWRVVRLSDSNHKIALGLSLGAAASFNPFLGTHFIQAGAFAYIFRGNLIAALIGTFVGTPWTFPFLWWAAISLGTFVISVSGLFPNMDLPQGLGPMEVVHTIEQHPSTIFLPWVIGAYLAGALSLLISYPIFYNLVRGAKAARIKAKQRKIHKAAQEITGQVP